MKDITYTVEEIKKWPRKLIRYDDCTFWVYASPDGGVYIDEDYVVERPEKEDE